MPEADFGLSLRHQALLQELLEQYAPLAEVWVYGSRVSGNFHQASDIDLVLRNPQDLSQRQENLYALKEAVRESNIPILVDIMDWAIIPKYFHEQILAEHQVWKNSKNLLP